MAILGIGGLLNDAACAVFKDGELKAAVEENKLNRAFRPGQIPEASIDECLRLAGSTRAAVECVAVARPFALGPESQFHLTLREYFPNAEIAIVEHHQAHAASAFFASPFEQATILTLDHSGDFRCGALWRGAQNQIEAVKEWYYPDSLGRLYGAVTEFLGFHARADEHKVQWLSASGDDLCVDVFREILQPSARLDPAFFAGGKQTAGGFGPKFTERVAGMSAASIARGVQVAVQERVAAMAGEGENLCLAGGLFFNVLLVEHLERSGKWKKIFVQAAAGNAGTALGAVFYVWHQMRKQTKRAAGGSLLLGSSYDAAEIKKVLENCKLRFRYIPSTEELLACAVRLLGEHKILAWMQGRMEFGPRALGNRSLLASPLAPYSTENLNIYIKHREPFRKFAASVPAELAGEYFDVGANARNLATIGRVRPAYRKTFEPAVLGLERGRDWVRVHTVEESENPIYHRLLHAAGAKTGLPVLYNTSFNLFGDPLVSTPRDAVRSFYSSGIDALLVGNFLLEK
ncbi:MAG: carbamoyltransferase [Bryobacterales bacterium]|nr:carbamoyltransferase [Bryobacterales bacterium]MBV9399018.1 carbamoyltransferase [Bryobacterales bacterium]